MCYGMNKPTTLDVKIGARCWEPCASMEKQQRQKLRCPYLDEVCFQILGARVSATNSIPAVLSMEVSVVFNGFKQELHDEAESPRNGTLA